MRAPDRSDDAVITQAPSGERLWERPTPVAVAVAMPADGENGGTAVDRIAIFLTCDSVPRLRRSQSKATPHQGRPNNSGAGVVELEQVSEIKVADDRRHALNDLVGQLPGRSAAPIRITQWRQTECTPPVEVTSETIAQCRSPGAKPFPRYTFGGLQPGNEFFTVESSAVHCCASSDPAPHKTHA